MDAHNEIRLVLEYHRDKSAAESLQRNRLDAALAALAELERAAAPKFEAVEVDDAMAARVELAYIDNGDHGRAMIAAVRAELGPALGLVEMREPTDGECKMIASDYFSKSAGADSGRAMFRAVCGVMWPKGGEG